MPELLQLQIGHKYCWRVTAYDPDGKLPFKRGGESDVYQFQYLNPPVPVTGLANKVTGKQIKYTWNADRNHTKYYVEYYDYKRDTTISSSQQDNTVTLTAPEYDYRIKFHVRAECYNDPARVSDYTTWSEAYVQPEKKIDFECGKQFPDREIANQELKTTFFEGEIVESKNGDSRYEIIKATARPDGSLDGKFYAIMDCWSGAKILCDFWDTKINTDNIILTTRYRSEDIPGFVADPEEIKQYVHELVNNAHMAATDNKIRDTILINQKFDYLYAENGRLKAVVVDKNGEPQVTDVTPDKPYSQSLITDGQGDTLVVSKKGQVMGVKEYKFAGDDRHLLNEYHRQLDSLGDWQINFNSAKEKQTYAFDQIGSGNHGIFATDQYYPTSGNYDFRYKSVECGKNDKVIVDYGSYPQADSVIFKDKYGVTLKLSKGNILNFTGTSQADTNYIYAYRGNKKIGKLMLNVYKRKPIKVCLVMVNGAHHKESFKEIKESLYKVFLPAVVEFEILSDEIEIPNLTSFSHGGSGILTVYNDDQKRVLQAYEKEKKMTDGVFYLFFIDNVTDKKDGSGTPVSGYMPRGYNAGFIYDGGSPHTIAHELGHGVAGLEHVFENSNNSGKTANLMDYANGEELWHFQWNQIQDPSRVWMKWNKAEEEGESLLPDHICVSMFVEKFRRAFVYKEIFTTETFSEYGTLKLVQPNSHNIFVRIDAEASSQILNEYSYIDYFVEDAKTDLFALKRYLYSSEDEYVKSIEIYLSIIEAAISKNNTNALLGLLTVLPAEEYHKIPIQRRLDIIKLLSDCFLTQAYLGCTDDEKIVINLIKHTPHNDYNVLLNYLFDNNIYQKLQSGIDGDNYIEFLLEMYKIWQRIYYVEVLDAKINPKKYEDNLFIWNRSNRSYITYKSESFVNDDIEIEYWYNDWFDTFVYENLHWGSYKKFHNKTFKAQDLVLLTFKTIPDFFFDNVNENTKIVGSTAIIPAFLFEAVITQTDIKKKIDYADFVITVGSLVIGIGEIHAAVGVAARGMAIFSVVSDVYNITTQNPSVNDFLSKLKRKKDSWSKLVYGWEKLCSFGDIKSASPFKISDYKKAYSDFKMSWTLFKESRNVYIQSYTDSEAEKAIDEYLEFLEPLLNN